MTVVISTPMVFMLNNIQNLKNMKKKIFYVVIICFCFFINTMAQITDNYNYENWNGKGGDIKTKIEIPSQFITNGMYLRESSTETFVRFRIALNEQDTLKRGYLHLKIFPNVEEAQLALVEYLNVFSNYSKPPRLTTEEFKVGDVAFGSKFDDILSISYVRNNVLVIVNAKYSKAKEILHTTDNAIQKATIWQKDMPKPLFVL